MNILKWRKVLALFVCQSLIFSPLIYAEQLSLPASDLIAPEVSHEAIKSTLEEGASLQLRAMVTDNVGVKSVTLYFRVIGSVNYKSVNMQRIGKSDEYAVTLGKQELVIPGIEYYIQAFDLAGNSLLHGYSFSPLKVSVISALDSSKALSETDEPNMSNTSQLPKKKSNNWIWISLGALAIGAIAAAASSGGGNDDSSPSVKPDGEGTSITINAPAPVN
jgi:hypothetical protein